MLFSYRTFGFAHKPFLPGTVDEEEASRIITSQRRQSLLMRQGETRKLAAIMFTDIVGFSRQMGSDEARMLRLLDVHNQPHSARGE